MLFKGYARFHILPDFVPSGDFWPELCSRHEIVLDLITLSIAKNCF